MIIQSTARYQWLQATSVLKSPEEYLDSQSSVVITDSAECLAKLPQPHLMKGALEAARFVFQAMVEKRPIVIFGDYDVDGTTSAAMLSLFFEELGVTVEVYIPERLVEGYGLNPIGLRNIRNKYPVETRVLVITVDNGIAAVEACQLALTLGIDVVITDHHDLPPQLPQASVIVNPKQPDCLFPYRMLAGAGVAFYVMAATRALLREHGVSAASRVNLKSYLDLVALGTIADLAPLDGVNHQLCKVGLEVMLEHVLTNKRPGVAQLLLLAGWKADAACIDASDVGFKIGPRLNAAGRLGNALATVELLRVRDELRAADLAQTLHLENAERQAIEKSITEEAFAQIEAKWHSMVDSNKSRVEVTYGGEESNAFAMQSQNNRNHFSPCALPSAFVLHQPDWHTGVVGIVASRILDKFYRPVLVLGSLNGKAKGSGRSTHAFNLFEAISPFREHLHAFGGHFHAVGLTLEEQKIPMLREFLLHQASTHDASHWQRQLKIDGWATLELLNRNVLDALRAYEPFGQGNPRPKWLLKNLLVKEVRRVGKGANSPHAKLVVASPTCHSEIIAFGLADALIEVQAVAGKNVDLVVEGRVQQFMGRCKPELRLIDFYTHH